MGENKKEQILAKVKRFFIEHESIRQLVVFTLCSLVCFVVEYATYSIIELCLTGQDAPFSWFIFQYDATRSFIAFLVSNILAQAMTFILNRKKTFKSTNNVLIASIMFAIMVIGIILLNTWLGGVVQSAAEKSFLSLGMEDSVANYVAGLAGKLTGSVASFVISFLGSKFLIMRNWKVASYKAAIYNAEYVREDAESSATSQA